MSHDHTSMTLLQRLLGGILGVLFLLAVFVFASIVFAVLVVGGAVLWGWLWWRARKLPRSQTIEGEFRDVTHLERLEDRKQHRV